MVPLAIVCAMVWYCGLHLVRTTLASCNNKRTFPTHVSVNKEQLKLNADELSKAKVCGVCTSPGCERKHIPAYGFHKLIEAEIPANVNAVLEHLLTRSIEGANLN